MPTLSWPAKYAEDDLPYKLDWTQAMENQASIIASEWDIPAGLTSHNEEVAAKTTIIWLSGGEPGAIYTIHNQITMSAEPWKLSQAVRIKVKQ